ncbi:NADH ubiquinone oxidoreductase, 20 Kd subunit, partial [Cutibacterium granulosum DSM 20700]
MVVQIIDWYGDGSVGVVDLALACCAVESGAARWLPTPSGDRSVDDAHLRPTMSLETWRAETSSGHADASCDERHPADELGRLVAVVSGTVAVGLANRVTRIIDELRATQPVHVVAFGACACAGGP